MSWNYIKQETPKAKKVHKCYLCGEDIKIGELHIARTGSFEGKILTNRMHFECEKVTEDWGIEDWECHEPCEFERPSKPEGMA